MSKQIASVILAGGKGKRLGGVLKANLKVGGESLLQRAKNSLSDSNGEKIISIGSTPKDFFNLSPNWVAIRDLGNGEIEQKGPLAGIVAGVDYLVNNNSKSEFLMSLAVDSVFFPPEFYKLAYELLDENIDVIIAKYEGQIYPTNALWRLSSIKDLPKRFDTVSKFGIKGILKSLKVIEMEIKSDDGFDPSQNINDIYDIIACAKRLKSEKITLER